MSQENKGFFKKFHDTINQGIDDVARNNFANLECNAKRASYLCSLPVIKSYDLSADVVKCQAGGEFPVKKDVVKAKQLKDEGNKAVQKGDWAKALEMYSQSMIFMPKTETEELSIVLANRSAALNHLLQYEDALADIQRCLSLGYPRHLQYKVYERKARSLLVLKRNQEAITAFQNTISALDAANKLDKEKRQKIATDAKLMLEILHKGLVLAGNPKDPEPLNKLAPKPKLPGKHNVKYPATSDAIEITKSDVKGRFAIASRDIEAGETLLVESPYGSALLNEYSRSHCQNCCIKCPIPVPCPKCPNVIFCSDNCLEIAQNSYHRYECQILPLIWKSGCSITCHIALRMITQNGKEYFSNISKDLETAITGPYKTEDYKNAYNLVSHEDIRSKQDLLHRTQMTIFLIKLLEISGYLEGKPKDTVDLSDIKSMSVDEKYNGDVGLFGALILKNLQVLQFNAHEVFEVQCPKPEVGKNIIKHTGTSVFLAGALFPTLALFNHSCDPSVARYFCGSKIVVRAVKNIKKGEEVSENYGPIFTTVPKETRQANLKNQYWFDCHCIPCQQNWPTYQDMTEDYIRFKCDSDKPCTNVVPVPYDCKEFMVQCGLCQQYTNVLKGLKSLQDTDMMYRIGRNAMDEGKYGDAMKKFIEVLKLYDTTLAPPYKSYYDCVQDLRHCILAMGNYSIV
ncbi:SET and MYND domain-containing protein 4-like [Achroia grisella]|uniref:SET and MYND domain-containing protein 4-like n=1 Tax=Achroia grisella TaxID=688607 RepID=UPI0027D2C728|nr:SET and MYND domain-containing protein 4-like [Achroia grisella]